MNKYKKNKELPAPEIEFRIKVVIFDKLSNEVKSLFEKHVEKFAPNKKNWFYWIVGEYDYDYAKEIDEYLLESFNYTDTIVFLKY